MYLFFDIALVSLASHNDQYNISFQNQEKESIINNAAYHQLTNIDNNFCTKEAPVLHVQNDLLHTDSTGKTYKNLSCVDHEDINNMAVNYASSQLERNGFFHNDATRETYKNVSHHEKEKNKILCGSSQSLELEQNNLLHYYLTSNINSNFSYDFQLNDNGYSNSNQYYPNANQNKSLTKKNNNSSLYVKQKEYNNLNESTQPIQNDKNSLLAYYLTNEKNENLRYNNKKTEEDLQHLSNPVDFKSHDSFNSAYLLNTKYKSYPHHSDFLEHYHYLNSKLFFQKSSL